jgi:hypothetical protein
MDYTFLFHNPVEIIDFHFVVMQTKQNLVNFFSKFLNNLFKIYSMVQLDDNIIVIIVNDENELKNIIKKMEYYFDSFKKYSLFGHAYCYELCIDEIIAAKIKGKFILYDKTIQEIENDKNKRIALLKMNHPINFQIMENEEELKVQEEFARNENIKKWKKIEFDISKKILDQYGSFQKFINLLNPNNPTQIYFICDIVLRHMLKEKIIGFTFDIVSLRMNIIKIFRSIIKELQIDPIMNKFVNFKIKHNMDMIDSLNILFEINKLDHTSKWNMIRDSYSENKEIVSKLLGIHIYYEMLYFMQGNENMYHHFDICQLELLLDCEQARRPIVPNYIYFDNLNINVPNKMFKYLYENDIYISKLLIDFDICFLLFISRRDINTLWNTLPIELLNLIVYYFIFNV